MLKAMSKFQGELKMFILGMLKTILKTVVEIRKKHHHTCVEIEQQISFFFFGFARVSEVRHM